MFYITFNDENEPETDLTFNSKEDARAYVWKYGALAVYNKWLDLIGNDCYVCEDEKEARELIKYKEV